jgi:hypothetical protein
MNTLHVSNESVSVVGDDSDNIQLMSNHNDKRVVSDTLIDPVHRFGNISFCGKFRVSALKWQ